MPCQTDKLVSGLPDEDLNPLTTSSRGGRGPGVGITQRAGEGGEERKKRKSFQFTAPSRWRPLNHRALRACCRRPRRVFGGCALHGYAGSEGLLDGVGVRRRRRWWGLLLLLLLLVLLVLSAALTNKRQTDNKSRQNAAYQAGFWSHGGDRSPCIGHALMLCCILSF